MRVSAGPGTLLTPHENFEGFQDTANAASVTGWAWDRDNPNVPIEVAIYDGNTLLATVTADIYRRDLQRRGIGDGRHAFAYSLAPHIHDRKSHLITTRIAHTDMLLRDVRTDGIPRPVTYRDQPAPIPHFSMSPASRFWYFTVLRWALAIFPFPIWRPLAVVLGIFHTVLDRQSRSLNRALLGALGLSASPLACWRLH